MRTLPPATAGPLLPWLLAALAPMPRTRVKQLLRFGQVTVNGVPVTQFDHPLAAGDRVAIAPARADPVGEALRQAGIRIVYEGDDLIAVDKPAGLLTVAFAGGGLPGERPDAPDPRPPRRIGLSGDRGRGLRGHDQPRRETRPARLAAGAGSPDDRPAGGAGVATAGSVGGRVVWFPPPRFG